MSTSQTSKLSKPEGREPISAPTLAYFRSRNRRRLHSLILQEFRDSGISQIELCGRLRKDPATVSKMLASPGNWGVDTASDLLFAIRGGQLNYSLDYPLDKPSRNFQGQESNEQSSELSKALGAVRKTNLLKSDTLLGNPEVQKSSQPIRNRGYAEQLGLR